tara:strand:- start:200 stop:1102 length:903 start_codon:yes stop_codon:yes gene_type:complete
MSYIGSKPATSFVGLSSQSFTGGSGTSFTLNKSVSSTSDIAVFVNNVRQNPTNSSYSVSGTTLTMSASIASSDIFYVVFLGATTGTVNPQAGSVGSSQITSEMITGLPALSTAPADTDEFMVSDAGVLKRIDASLVVGGGKVLQVVSTTKTDTFVLTASNGTFTDVTGLSVAITPSNSSSKVFVTCNLNLSGSGRNGAFKLLRDSTAIAIGDADGSRPRATGGSLRNNDASGDGFVLHTASASFLDSPSTTSSTTYKIQVANTNTTGSSSTYVNRTYEDSSSSDYGIRGASTITVFEVGV